jgi:Uma2 family endonuclease
MNAVSQPQRYLISVEQYERMGEAGVFAPDERLELIDGEILEMPPMNTAHAWAVAALNREFMQSPLGQHVFLLPQLPVILSDLNEPQPDLVLARLPQARYRTAKARPEDIVLLVEVSDTTLRFDRQRKMPLYARHGVAESWILNVQDRRLEVFRRPQDGVYSEVFELAPGTPAHVAAFAHIAFEWSVGLT